MSRKVGLGRVVARGWRRRCPHCGRGRVLSGWLTIAESCSNCEMRLTSNLGDTWGFWVIGDRIFVAGPMLVLYLGFTPIGIASRLFWLAAIVAVFFWTMPHRLGICVALDYWVGQRFGDSSESS